MAELNKMKFFLRSEKAQLAPAEDLPTMMILIILLTIFIVGAANAYDNYNKKNEFMDKLQSGLNFLDTLKNNVLAEGQTGESAEPGRIYIDVNNAKASVNVDESKMISGTVKGSNKTYYFYNANDPFKLSPKTRSIQDYWNRMYLYEIIIKDEGENNVYVFHGGWGTKFSSLFSGEKKYLELFDYLVNQRLDVVALDLPIAIHYGTNFTKEPLKSLNGQIRAGKIEVLIW